MISIEKKVLTIAKKAKKAAQLMAMVSTDEKNKALRLMAKNILAHKKFLIRENQKDLKVAQAQGYPKALVDRLTLDEKRIKVMADCLLDTAHLKDPIGEVLSSFKRPNGLMIQKVRTPIGVIGIIYESRPNVTSDCIGLCLKSGNVAILKGGKEAFYSNKAIFNVLKKAISKTKIPKEAVHLILSIDRKAVTALLKLDEYVDVIIPRGGESLIKFVAQNSCIPVIKHYKGVCHTFVSQYANLKMAYEICYNAKVQRPGVCNAMETMLVDERIAKRFLPKMIALLKEAGVEIRGCARTQQIIREGIKKAVMSDWPEEYLDLILAVKVVKNLKEAIEHINTYGSKHSDAIVTNNKKEAQEFLKAIDSSCLYVNASTRFTDGYEFGFGAEIGISTDKLHARGPMALPELTTYKYFVLGKGQIRK